MAIYFLLMISFIIGSDFIGLEKAKLYLSTLFLIIISSIRYYVGVDYQTYAYIYDWLGRGLADFQIEKSPLFATIMQLSIKFNLGYQFVIFVSALIFLIAYQYFIMNIVERRYWMLSYFLLFSTHLIFFSFNIFRQCLGLGIVLMGFVYWYKNKKRKLTIPALCHFFAFFIHSITIIFIFIYIFDLIFRKKSNSIKIIFLILYLVSMIFIIINPMKLIQFFPIEILGRYANYFGSIHMEKNNLAILKQIFPNIVFIYYFSQYWSKKVNAQKYFDDVIFYGSFLYIVINNIGTGSELLIRIAVIFQVFFIVAIIGSLLSISPINNYRTFAYWSVIIYGFVMVGWLGISNGYGVSQYEVFFDKPLLIQKFIITN